MRLLVAEDEEMLSSVLVTILEKNKYTVDAVFNGYDALTQLESQVYDGAILDIMMPKLDGITVLRKIREKENPIPVLLLTAKSEIDDKVYGLDSGANDYLSKPFDTRELLARVRAMTKNQNVPSNCELIYGNITLNRITFEIKSASNSFRLAPTEFQLMEMFMKHPHCHIREQQIMEKLHPHDCTQETTVVEMYTSFLNKKLKALQANIRITRADSETYLLEEKQND